MPCCPRPEPWVVRAQPWLGTLVEVALTPADASEARFAAAFAVIGHVHRRMSAHDPASDLARIARFAHRRPVRVDRETAAVLRLALRLARATAGAFDVTVGPAKARRTAAAGMAALHLDRGRRVRTDTALALDLGGIAKGHAVDRAVEALRRSGAAAGIVNAGGDLRAFGAERWTPVRVRLPGASTIAAPLFELRDAASATSSDAFRGRNRALFDPLRRRHRPYPGSVTVVAPSCAVADALTKIVALRPGRAPRLLARLRADAFRIAPGAAACFTSWQTPGRRLRLALDRQP